jgi:hypothetical protein
MLAVVSLFDAVLRLRIRNGLPLHVACRVGPASLQRCDVVDDVSRTPPSGFSSCWTRMASPELGTG